jgi:hypothetical protein
MYNMTALAVTLNELPADPSTLPRTDCRLRPDLRALENGTKLIPSTLPLPAPQHQPPMQSRSCVLTPSAVPLLQRVHPT